MFKRYFDSNQCTIFRVSTCAITTISSNVIPTPRCIFRADVFLIRSYWTFVDIYENSIRWIWNLPSLFWGHRLTDTGFWRITFVSTFANAIESYTTRTFITIGWSKFTNFVGNTRWTYVPVWSDNNSNDWTRKIDVNHLLVSQKLIFWLHRRPA